MIRWRWLWFVASMLLLVAAWPASNRLTFDRSLDRMFASDDPVRLDFEFLQSRFAVSDLVVFAYRDPNLWSTDGSGLQRLEEIRKQIERVPGIASAMDLSKIDAMLAQSQAPLSWLGNTPSNTHPLLDPKNEIAQSFKRLFEGQTHAKDSDLVAIACLLETRKPNEHSLGEIADASTQTSRTLAQLRALGDSLPDLLQTPVLLVGQPVMVEEGFEEIEQDGRRLGYVSAIVLSGLIILGFRSVRWAIIVILVVQWSLIVTRGLLTWLAWDLTMVSSMLSSIVTVIGVATVVHWMLGYQNARASGMEPEAALCESMRLLWHPIVWAVITDAIGFASLAFAKVGPVQDYGCMMALASMVVLVGIFGLVPTLALLSLAPAKIASRVGLSHTLFEIPGDRWLRRWILDSSLEFSLRWPIAISLASMVLSILAIWGSWRLQVETDFIRNFRPDAPLVVAYRAVESELGGAGVWDVVLPAPKVLTNAYLDQVLALEQELKDIEVAGEHPLKLSHAMSFADADRSVQASPVLGKLSIESRLLGMRQLMGSFVDTMLTQDAQGKRWLRVMLRAREQSEASQKQELIEKVKHVVQNKVDSPEWKSLWSTKNPSIADANLSAPVVSGYYVLLARLVESVVADQWRCFLVATAGIWLAMSIALRSPWLATLSIFPNALPSLCIMGVMGWLEMRVNLGAAMIAAVSMGMSVDTSLHYLARFQRELQTSTFERAVHAAQSEIGMAMLLSTVALVLGFGSLASSHFLPTVVFGTTAAISMLGGLVCNLLILPALLQWLGPSPTHLNT